MYSLQAVPNHQRVDLSFDGEMGQDPAQFSAEFTRTVKLVRPGNAEWDLLVDFSKTPVMPQQRAENTARIFEWCLQNKIRKCAFVIAGITQRMQLKRVTKSNKKIKFFETSNAAESWLGA